MLNTFFSCCTKGEFDKEGEFDLELKNLSTNPRDLNIELTNIRLNLKNKLCLFTIYSKAKELFPFNELKNSDDLTDILANKYFEIYKRTENIVAQTFIKSFNLQNFSLITMIISINEKDGNFKLIDYLKDENATRHNIKQLLKIYEHLLYKPPKEPDINSPNCCSITFRFVDDSLSFNRKYNKNTKIKELYYLLYSLYPKLQFRLFKTSPSAELEELNNTLENEGLFPTGIIQVVS